MSSLESDPVIEFQNESLSIIPSHANFVFFHSGRNISALNKEMRDQGIWIGRPFPPKLEWCRISTGTMEDMEKFVKGLNDIL